MYNDLVETSNNGRMRSPLAQSINFGLEEPFMGGQGAQIDVMHRGQNNSDVSYEQPKNVRDSKAQSLSALAPPLSMKTIEGEFSRQINQAGSFNNAPQPKPEVAIFKMKENDSNLTPSTG